MEEAGVGSVISEMPPAGVARGGGTLAVGSGGPGVGLSLRIIPVQEYSLVSERLRGSGEP